jgi:hypothetical protein
LNRHIYDKLINVCITIAPCNNEPSGISINSFRQVFGAISAGQRIPRTVIQHVSCMEKQVYIPENLKASVPCLQGTMGITDNP